MHLADTVKSIQEQPQRFRVGDRIIVTNPDFVERVGYPMAYEDAYDYIANNYMKDVDTLIRHTVFHIDGEVQKITPFAMCLSEEKEAKHSKDLKQLIGALAKMHMKHERFGGPVRSIHTKTLESELGRIATITGKRTCKTGIYDAPYGYRDHNGEYEYYPGGLSQEKTHVLLELDVFFTMAYESKDWHRYPGTWIENKNVRLYDGPELGESPSAYAKRMQKLDR